MDRREMARRFEAHREAEARRDIEGVLDTFVDDPFLDNVPLGLRSEGRDAVRAAYAGFFTAFPDLTTDDRGSAFSEDAMVVWGSLRGTSGGEWFGAPQTGRTFNVPFANVASFRDGRMAGETIYFDLATLCEQAGLPLEVIRRAAEARRALTE